MTRVQRLCILWSGIALVVYQHLARIELPSLAEHASKNADFLNLVASNPYRQRILLSWIGELAAKLIPGPHDVVAVGAITLVGTLGLIGFLYGSYVFISRYTSLDRAVLGTCFIGLAFNSAMQGYDPYILPYSWVECGLIAFALVILYDLFERRLDRRRALLALAIIIVLGAINRNTIALVLVWYGLLMWKYRLISRHLVGLGVLTVLWFLALRLVAHFQGSDTGTLGGVMYVVFYNIGHFGAGFVPLAVLFGALWVLAPRRYRDAPRSLQAFALGVLVYLGIDLAYSAWNETRTFILIAPVVIALVLYSGARPAESLSD